MIVLDASALVELILNTPAGKQVGNRIADPAEALHVPHLADVEITQALRRYVRQGEMRAADALAGIQDLRRLGLRRHAHEPLLARVWELRDRVSAYDAVYVALAEALDTVVLTCDGPFSRAPGLCGRVKLIC